LENAIIFVKVEGEGYIVSDYVYIQRKYTKYARLLKRIYSVHT